MVNILTNKFYLYIQSVSLPRSRRWILSWLMNWGLPKVNETVSAAEPNVAYKIDNSLDSAAERSNDHRDLSGDTKVNYMEGRGRNGAKFHEGN